MEPFIKVLLTSAQVWRAYKVILALSAAAPKAIYGNRDGPQTKIPTRGDRAAGLTTHQTQRAKRGSYRSTSAVRAPGYAGVGRQTLFKNCSDEQINTQHLIHLQEVMIMARRKLVSTPIITSLAPPSV